MIVKGSLSLRILNGRKGKDMSAFYGQIKGMADSLASRRGSMESGIKASVQSWDGSMITSMRYVGGGADG